MTTLGPCLNSFRFSSLPQLKSLESSSALHPPPNVLAAHIAECARGTRRMGSRARRMGSRRPPNGLAKSSRRTCSRKLAEKTLTFQSQNSEESPFSRRTCSRRPPNGLECEELGIYINSRSTAMGGCHS